VVSLHKTEAAGGHRNLHSPPPMAKTTVSPALCHNVLKSRLKASRSAHGSANKSLAAICSGSRQVAGGLKNQKFGVE
jgi:hypothetical protein